MLNRSKRYKYVPTVKMIVDNGIGIANANKVIEDYIKVGEGITGNMRGGGFLKAEHRVLDVGCGLGRLARPLVGFLLGEYHGIDTNKSSINWCKENFQDVSNFYFYFSDVYSTSYNTSSVLNAQEYTFPFSDACFDFVWSTSLFTHMLIDQFARYISEMSRVMVSGAHCWNTYLLLDHFADEAAAKLDGSTRWCLPYRVDGGRVRSLDDTASQVALDEERVVKLHLKAGLEIVDIRYGPWSGRTTNVRAGGQDVIIARKI